MITQHAMSYHYKLANGPVLCNGTLCQSFVGVVVDRYDIIYIIECASVKKDMYM